MTPLYIPIKETMCNIEPAVEDQPKHTANTTGSCEAS